MMQFKTDCNFGFKHVGKVSPNRRGQLSICLLTAVALTVTYGNALNKETAGDLTQIECGSLFLSQPIKNNKLHLQRA